MGRWTGNPRGFARGLALGLAPLPLSLALGFALALCVIGIALALARPTRGGRLPLPLRLALALCVLAIALFIPAQRPLVGGFWWIARCRFLLCNLQGMLEVGWLCGRWCTIIGCPI